MEQDHEMSTDPQSERLGEGQIRMPEDSQPHTERFQEPKIENIFNYVVPPTMQPGLVKDHDKAQPITLQNNGLGLDNVPQPNLARQATLDPVNNINGPQLGQNLSPDYRNWEIARKHAVANLSTGNYGLGLGNVPQLEFVKKPVNRNEISEESGQNLSLDNLRSGNNGLVLPNVPQLELERQPASMTATSVESGRNSSPYNREIPGKYAVANWSSGNNGLVLPNGPQLELERQPASMTAASVESGQNLSLDNRNWEVAGKYAVANWSSGNNGLVLPNVPQLELERQPASMTATSVESGQNLSLDNRNWEVAGKYAVANWSSGNNGLVLPNVPQLELERQPASMTATSVESGRNSSPYNREIPGKYAVANWSSGNNGLVLRNGPQLELERQPASMTAASVESGQNLSLDNRNWEVAGKYAVANWSSGNNGLVLPNVPQLELERQPASMTATSVESGRNSSPYNREIPGKYAVANWSSGNNGLVLPNGPQLELERQPASMTAASVESGQNLSLDNRNWEVAGKYAVANWSSGNNGLVLPNVPQLELERQPASMTATSVESGRNSSPYNREIPGKYAVANWSSGNNGLVLPNGPQLELERQPASMTAASVESGQNLSLDNRNWEVAGKYAVANWSSGSNGLGLPNVPQLGFVRKPVTRNEASAQNFSQNNRNWKMPGSYSTAKLSSKGLGAKNNPQQNFSRNNRKSEIPGQCSTTKNRNNLQDSVSVSLPLKINSGGVQQNRQQPHMAPQKCIHKIPKCSETKTLPRPEQQTRTSLCVADLIGFDKNDMEDANPFALAREAHQALERYMKAKAESQNEGGSHNTNT